jgi:hypothetical protein
MRSFRDVVATGFSRTGPFVADRSRGPRLRRTADAPVASWAPTMTRRAIGTVVLTLLFGLAPAVAGAQTTDAQTRSRLDTLLTSAAVVPDSKGLVPTALAEGHRALAAAVRAADASADLATLRAAATEVVQASDPARSGDGTGYGVLPALADIVREVELLLATDTKRDVVVAGPKALAAAKQAQAVAGEVVTVAERIAAARSAGEAASLTRELAERAGELLSGVRGLPQCRARSALGGLAAVQAHLAAIYAGRTGALPASLAEGRTR